MTTAHRWGIVLACVCWLSVPRAWGQREGMTPPPAVEHDRVDDAMGRYNLLPAFTKLGRGVSNALGGWLEIPINIHHRYAKSDVGTSFVTGLLYGVVKGVVRTAVGAYETVTFFLPYPEHFAPILPTLEYFQQSKKRERLPGEW